MPVEVVGLGDVAAYDEVPETGATFEENALIKARDGGGEHRPAGGGRRLRA